MFHESHLSFTMRQRNLNGKIKKECSGCNNPLEENRIGKQRYCLACHNKQMRDTRIRYSELSPEAKMKSIARSYLKVNIKRGKVKKLPCQVCGNEKSEGHHADYSKPLEVVWLCKRHHIDLHKELKMQDETKLQEERKGA